ncbi:RNA polymerase sigma factor sigX [Stenotrophomonas maltophilia SKK35]|nr:RNA polymerase sigma factor sigX [Stenotrophomonas maltophilia SKK35]
MIRAGHCRRCWKDAVAPPGFKGDCDCIRRPVSPRPACRTACCRRVDPAQASARVTLESAHHGCHTCESFSFRSAPRVSFMPPHHEQLGVLYRDHRAWLQGWLSSRVGNRDVADDLTQDTFARLLQGRDLAALREPRAFLTTIARGLAANWFRRQALERAYLEYLAQFPEPVLPSLEEQALVREALQQIDAMLDGLPAMARRVFMLAQFDGLRYEAISEQLGLSLSTVKRHMKRALMGCLAHAG